MATVNHSQQSFGKRDPTFASAAEGARWGSVEVQPERASAIRADSSESVRSGSTRPTYPVLLRLADVSAVSAEDLVHLTPLMVESALETLGSGKASPRENGVHSFASLLAASPSLQRSAPGSSASSPAPIVEKRYAVEQTTPPGSRTSEFYQAASATPPQAEQQLDNVLSQRRIDRPSIKPLRRPFKLTRPAWMPEIPPTLVLGLLICFTALLVGMLWRGSDPAAGPNGDPVAHDQEAVEPADSNGASPVQAKVTEVPQVPKVVDKKQPAKSTPEATAARPTEKKVSKAQPQARAKKPVEVSQQQPAEVKSAAEEIPAPRITGIRALPPVESYSQVAEQVRPSGQPAPQIVENPHVAKQNPVFEARRPTAEFQGTITPPDAAAPHERF